MNVLERFGPRRLNDTLSGPLPVVGLAAALLAAAIVASIAAPLRALACTPEGPEFGHEPVAVAVSGTILSGPDSSGDLRVSIDGLYAGSLGDPWVLHIGNLCNYPSEKLRAGQRLVAVSYGDPAEFGHPNQLNTHESLIWLLDDAGDVTFDMNGSGQDFATLADVLAGLSLPDAAMRQPQPDLVPIGYALILASLVLGAIRSRRLLHD